MILLYFSTPDSANGILLSGEFQSGNNGFCGLLNEVGGIPGSFHVGERLNSSLKHFHHGSLLFVYQVPLQYGRIWGTSGALFNPDSNVCNFTDFSLLFLSFAHSFRDLQDYFFIFHGKSSLAVFFIYRPKLWPYQPFTNINNFRTTQQLKNASKEGSTPASFQTTSHKNTTATPAPIANAVRNASAPFERPDTK